MEPLVFPNKSLADHLEQIGKLYILDNDTYRAKTFIEAAQKISLYPDLITSGQDAKIKIGRGVGESLISVIDEYLSTGTSKRLEELKFKNKERQEVLDSFMLLHGIGPVKAIDLYNQGFRTYADLYYRGAIPESAKLSIFYREHLALRIPRAEMDLINAKFHQLFPMLDLVIVGSYRRGEPDSGDIDVLIKNPGGLDLGGVVTVLKKHDLLKGDFAQGASKYLGLFRLPGFNVHRLDILLINPDSWGTALLYFTGSQQFNILMRQRAKDLGLRLNEYGLYKISDFHPERKSDLIKLDTPTEESVFQILNLKFLTPEERTRSLTSLAQI